jgi:hypothetical protein
LVYEVIQKQFDPLYLQEDPRCPVVAPGNPPNVARSQIKQYALGTQSDIFCFDTMYAVDHFKTML